MLRLRRWGELWPANAAGATLPFQRERL